MNGSEGYEDIRRHQVKDLVEKEKILANANRDQVAQDGGGDDYLKQYG
jgi:hypothetical protein